MKQIHYLFDFVFSLYKLFPAYISAKNTGSLVNSFVEVKILIPFPSFTSPSPSSGGMVDLSTISSSLSAFSVSSSDSSLSPFSVSLCDSSPIHHASYPSSSITFLDLFVATIFFFIFFFQVH